MCTRVPAHKSKACDACNVCMRCQNDDCLEDHPSDKGKTLARERALARAASVTIARGEPRLEARIVADLNEDALTKPITSAILKVEEALAAETKYPARGLGKKLNDVGVPLLLRERLSPLDIASLDAEVGKRALNYAEKIFDMVKSTLVDEKAASKFEEMFFERRMHGEDVRVMRAVSDMFMRAPNSLERRRAFAVCAHLYKGSRLVEAIDGALNRALADPDVMNRFADNAYYKSVKDDDDDDSVDGNDVAVGLKSTVVRRSAEEVLKKFANWAKSSVRTKRAEDDYNHLLASGSLPTKPVKSRVEQSSIRRVLEFLEKHSLGFAGGKTRTFLMHDGSNEQLAYFNMSMTLTEAWGAYSEAIGEVGYPTFREIYNLVCRLVTEKHSLSYYFTDAIAAISLLEDMAKRVKQLWEEYHDGDNITSSSSKASTANIDSILSSFPMVRDHMKYGLREHIILDPSMCDGIAMHCGAFAVGAECSKKEHESTSNCKKCLAFTSFPISIQVVVKDMIDALSAEQPNDELYSRDKKGGPVHELSSMIPALGWCTRTLNLYHRHLARGIWQNQSIDAMMKNLDTKTVALIIDHKQKVEPIDYNESAVAYFGKKGMSVLSCAFRFRRDDQGAVETRFFDVVITSNKQNASQVQTVLQAMIKEGARLFPAMKNVIIVSDNGASLSNSSNIFFVWSRNNDGWEGAPNVRVKRWMYFEAQCGKTVLDTHFSYLGNALHRYARRVKPVQTPKDVFDAFVFEGGIKGTSTALLDMDTQRNNDDVDDEEEDGTAAGKIPRIKGLRSSHDVVFPLVASDGSSVKICDQSNTRDFQTVLPTDADKVARRQYELLYSSFGELSPTPASGAAASTVSPSESPDSAKKSTHITSARLRMIQEECKSFVTNRSLTPGDIVRYVPRPSAATSTTNVAAGSEVSKTKKVKVDPMALFEEFAPTFKWNWSVSEIRKTIPMSQDLEREVQALFEKGEATGIKYSPASASMHMLNNPDVAKDWTSRLAISEDGIKKVFTKMSQLKKKEAKTEAKQKLNASSAALESSTSTTQ